MFDPCFVMQYLVSFLVWHFFCGSDFLCFLCLLWCLFIVAMWSPVGRGLTSWLSCVLYFLVSLSHMESWVSCGT